MNQKEMLARCKEAGLDVTIPLIYRAGHREGFIIKQKDSGRERYSIDEELFQKWIESAKIPDEYIAIKEVKKQYNIPFQAIKYLLIKNNCEMKKLGAIDGGYYYAKKSDIERVIPQYRKRS